MDITNYHPDYVHFLCEDGKSIAPCFERITEWGVVHAEANDFHLGKFTKSELTEIMNGALYEQEVSGDVLKNFLKKS